MTPARLRVETANTGGKFFKGVSTMRFLSTLAALVVAGPLVVSAQERPAQDTATVTVRGKIVRLEGTDRFVIRTSDNKDVTLYASPTTRYTIEGKAGRYSDLRVGTEITGVYIPRNERFMVTTVTVGAVAAPPPQAAPPAATPPPQQAGNGTLIRAKLLRVQGKDQIIVRTDAGKEYTLYVGPTARFVINGKAGQLVDLRPGADVAVIFTERDNRQWIETVTVGDVTAVEPIGEGTTVSGTVLRVVGEDQVVVRTTDNKEVVVYVVPQTKYIVDEQPARFTDFRTGSDVRIVYDVRDRRNMARSIIGIRRNKN
jgi:hypothetical protein